MTPAPLTLASSMPAPVAEVHRGFIQLHTLDDARAFADILCKTDLVPKDYVNKPGNAIVAMQMGMEIGLPPLQAIQGIAVVNGRPAIWGDALRALILSAPDLEDISETSTDDTATCSITRRGRSPVVRTFSQADAKAAGLAGKPGPWTQYPKRMRQLRAFAFCARDAYADRLRGLSSADELDDIEPREKNVTPRQPQRVSQDDVAHAGRMADAAARALAREAAADQAELDAAPVAELETKTANPEKPATGATDVLRQVQLLDGVYVAGAGNKAARWEVTTNQGTVYVLDEGLYQQIETCFGTDHTFALTVKFVKASTGLARIVTQLDVEEA
jgi:hypothetical protein